MLTWANVKQKLRSKDTLEILEFLTKIVDEGNVNQIYVQINRLNTHTSERDLGTITIEQHTVYNNQILHGVLNIMDGISDSDLKKDWNNMSIIVNLFNQDEYGNSKTIYSNTSITLEKTLIQVPDTPGLIASKNKHKFKIELMKAQDLIIMKDYSQAYDCCKKVQEKLEMESPQLYEFMLLTYFHSEGVKNIVDDTFDHDGKKLRLIQLYAERCFTLNDMIRGKKEDKEKEVQGLYESKTVNSTIRNILKNLAENINQKYASEIRYDYILNGINNNKKNISDRKARDFFINFFNVVNDLTNRFNFKDSNTQVDIDEVLVTLLENVLNELNGGNSLAWFELDYNRKPKNKTIFNAVAAREEIIKSIKKIKGEKFEVFQTRIIDRLYHSLVFKCSSIYLLSGETSKRRSAVVYLIESCLIAYEFYKEERFLDIALDELIHEELLPYVKKIKDNRYIPFEGKKGLDNWFTLNHNAEIIVRDSTLSKKRDIFADLEYMLNICWNKEKLAIIDSLKKRIALEMLITCNNEYEQVKTLVQTEPNERERKSVIKHLSNWNMCYKVLGQNEILDFILKELVGEGTSFCWFDFSEDGGFESNFETKKLNAQFDTYAQLRKILGIKFSDKQNESVIINIYKQIYESIYKEMNYKYERLPERMNYQLRKNHLINLVKRCEKGHFNKLTNDRRFINLASIILSNDTHINWLFYLQFTNKFINEHFQRLVDELPQIKKDFLNEIIDIEKAKLSESAYQEKPEYVPEKKVDTLDFILGQKSFIVYLLVSTICFCLLMSNESSELVFYSLILGISMIILSAFYHWFFKDKTNL